jgi:hypothetical protein
MLTPILFAAALAGAPDGAARPDPAAPTPAPTPARTPASAAAPLIGSDAGQLEADSLSEADLAAQAASVTARDEQATAAGEFAPAVQSGMALDYSRIENFTPPKPEPTAIPMLGGLNLPTTFGR